MEDRVQPEEQRNPSVRPFAKCCSPMSFAWTVAANGQAATPGE